MRTDRLTNESTAYTIRLQPSAPVTRILVHSFVLRRLFINILTTGLVTAGLIVSAPHITARQLQLTSENGREQMYEFRNDSLQIRHAFEWLVPGSSTRSASGSVDSYLQIHALELASVSESERDMIAEAYALSDDETPVFELRNAGMMRGQAVQSLIFHPARVSGSSDEEIIVVRSARFSLVNGVMSDRSRPEQAGLGAGLNTGLGAGLNTGLGEGLDRGARTSARTSNRSDVSGMSGDAPFQSGTWLKIPVPENGIYEMDAQYLTEAGLDPGSADPRRFQIWGTPGGKLPERNDAARPFLQQIPILVTGEGDGSFDTEDRILFYADGPNQVYQNPVSGTLTHETHPFSDVHHLFFTIGDEPGERLTAEPYREGDQIVRETRDLLVHELEEFKSENKIKSGRIWFSDRLTNTAAGRTQTILETEVPGLNTGQPVTLEIQFAGRSLQPLNVSFSLNGAPVGSRTINPINSYSSEEGLSARMGTLYATTTVASQSLQLEATLSTSDPAGEAFFDWVRISFNRSLTAGDSQVLHFFAPILSVADGTDLTYELQGYTAEPIVMDVSNPQQPRLVSVEQFGSSFRFTAAYETATLFTTSTNPTSTTSTTNTANTASTPNTTSTPNPTPFAGLSQGQRFVAQATPSTPLPAVAVPTQNLTGETAYPDYLIITSETFRDLAEEWAEYRRSRDQFTVVVATQQEIFHEFSGGTQDPTALRDYVKFHYDRALAHGREPLQHLLLFGGATFDYKDRLEGPLRNHVVTYQSEESLHRINSYGSDDFFGLLDETEGEWSPQTSSERIDIGIGRFPVNTLAQARGLMQKIQRYESAESLGDWRNRFVFVADDDFPEVERNRDLHALNADGTAVEIDKNGTATRVDKIYMLSYPVENSAEGRRLPGVRSDMIRAFNEGALVVNYSGHGGQFVLSDEKIFTVDDVPLLTNADRPTIFVTATCQFGRYDDHESFSGAEETLLWDEGGTVAALTTTRVVYTSSTPGSNNFGLNIQLTRKMLERDEEGLPLRLGDVYRRTKNTSQGAGFNARKFILLGDPAMRTGLPQGQAVVQTINGIDLAANPDTVITIRALDRIRFSGMVRDASGMPREDFQGEATMRVFDAERNVRLPDLVWVQEDRCFLDDCRYTVENDLLFNGRSTIVNGMFDAEFIVPADINFSGNTGRILVYASSDAADAGASSAQLLFNGINPDAEQDSEGPVMDVYLNDPAFVNGNLVGSTSTLLVDLEDPSGINTTGTGIGHEMIATIDTTPQKTILLNEYYRSEADQYQRGRIEYPLEALPSGMYRLNVRAWDVFNNASEQEIQFEVADSGELEIRNVYNYPNPMSQTTRFVFEHNQPGNVLDIHIRIFTLSGVPVTELNESQITSNAYAYIEWNGLDRNYDRLANGTYLYVLRVGADTPEGRQTREKIEKFVIIR